jgi:hypothetical protein
MLVLDALFDHFQQISSNVEIIGSLVQCSPISAIDVRVGVITGNTLVEHETSALPPKADMRSGRSPVQASNFEVGIMLYELRTFYFTASKPDTVKFLGTSPADGVTISSMAMEGTAIDAY